MKREIRDKIPPILAERYRSDHPEGSDDDMVRAWWRSIVCMTCGGCCHSSLIPITGDDLHRFADRLGRDRSSFERAFLQDPATSAPTFTIETARYGGRCMFLTKRDRLFACSCWDDRADVCADFFCWPMTLFARFEQGEEQEMFDPAQGWEENFLALFDKVVEEMGGALFADDLFNYIKSQKSDRFDAAGGDS